MPARVVRVAHVVYLEAERMLQVVAGLLIGQPGHDGGPLADARYLHALCFWQRAGSLADLAGRGYPVRAAGPADLGRRADVTQFPDAVVAVVVRQAVRVGHRARGLAEQRG